MRATPNRLKNFCKAIACCRVVLVWNYIHKQKIIKRHRLINITEETVATHSSTLAWRNPMEGGAW